MPTKRRRAIPDDLSSTNVLAPPLTTSAPSQPDVAMQQRKRHDIADLFPYQELFLRVLSFLSPTELAMVQGVSKYWAKMALDPQVSITSLSSSCLLANAV